MTEEQQIARSERPLTVASLVGDLLSLGIQFGDTLLVHTSLSSLGWVNGGPVAVIEALLRAVGPEGTIVMPAHSAGLTDPANWGAPPVPASWHQTIRETMPAYDPGTTPTRDMGRVAELFRTWPGALRSDHPSASFAARGPLAGHIIGRHDLTDPLGEGSPLGALYRRDAKVLLIGVDFDRCTALHLAERRAWPDRPRIAEGAPVMRDGQRRWVAFEVPGVMDSAAFLPIGASALRSGMATARALGEGRGILVGMRQIVDHAVELWTAGR